MMVKVTKQKAIGWKTVNSEATRPCVDMPLVNTDKLLLMEPVLNVQSYGSCCPGLAVRNLYYNWCPSSYSASFSVPSSFLDNIIILQQVLCPTKFHSSSVSIVPLLSPITTAQTFKINQSCYFQDTSYFDRWVLNQGQDISYFYRKWTCYISVPS